MLAEDLRHPCISLSVKPPAPPMHRPHYIAPRTLPPGHRATVGFPTEHSVPGTLPPVGCPQYTAPAQCPQRSLKAIYARPLDRAGPGGFLQALQWIAVAPPWLPCRRHRRARAPGRRRGQGAAATTAHLVLPLGVLRSREEVPEKKKSETCKVRPFRDLKTP